MDEIEKLQKTIEGLEDGSIPYRPKAGCIVCGKLHDWPVLSNTDQAVKHTPTCGHDFLTCRGCQNDGLTYRCPTCGCQGFYT